VQRRCNETGDFSGLHYKAVRARYRNGNATPTDVVDSEAALIRSQQRFFSAPYLYLAALVRLDYALGQHPVPGAGAPGCGHPVRD
jgi:outer membrane protein TolC